MNKYHMITDTKVLDTLKSVVFVCLFMVCNTKYGKRLISSEIVSMIDFGLVLGLWCLTPLSTTFQIYHGG